jgi:hypothetical protein
MSKTANTTPPKLAIDSEALIRKGAILNAKIKALVTEFEQDVKTPLKEFFGQNYDTYVADDGAFTVAVKPYRRLNETRVAEMFPDGEATEPKITPTATAKAVGARWAGKPDKIEKKLASLYDESPSLTFALGK